MRALAGGRDLSGDLEPEAIGGTGRRRVAAFPLGHVRPVDARRRNPDQDLAGPGPGHRALHDAQNLGAAAPGGDHAAHGLRNFRHSFPFP